MMPPSHPSFSSSSTSSSSRLPPQQSLDSLPLSRGIPVVPSPPPLSHPRPPSPALGFPLYAHHIRQNCSQHPPSADFPQKRPVSSASDHWQHQVASPLLKPVQNCLSQRHLHSGPSCRHTNANLAEQHLKTPSSASQLKETLFPPGFEPKGKAIGPDSSMECSNGCNLDSSSGMPPQAQPCTHPDPERSSQASYQGISYPHLPRFSQMSCQVSHTMCVATSFLSSYVPNYEMHNAGGTVMGVPVLNAPSYMDAPAPRPMFEGFRFHTASNSNESQYSRNAFKLTKYFRGNHLHHLSTDRESHTYKWHPYNIPTIQQSHIRPVTDSPRYNTNHCSSTVEAKLLMSPRQMEKDFVCWNECRDSTAESSQCTPFNEGKMTKFAREEKTKVSSSANDKFRSPVPLNMENKSDCFELQIQQSKIQPTFPNNFCKKLAEQTGQVVGKGSQKCLKLMTEAEAQAHAPVQVGRHRELDENELNIHNISGKLCNRDMNDENYCTENINGLQGKIIEKNVEENLAAAEKTTSGNEFGKENINIEDDSKNSRVGKKVSVAKVAEDKNMVNELKTCNKDNECSVCYIACTKDANTVDQNNRIKTTMESGNSNDSNTGAIENGICDIVNIDGKHEWNVLNIDNAEERNCKCTERNHIVTHAEEVEHDVLAAESVNVIQRQAMEDPDLRSNILETISQKNVHGSSSGCAYRVKRAGNEFSTDCKRYKYGHLPTSNGNEALKEISYLLQCCRFIVNNSFLQLKSAVGVKHFLWLETKETDTSGLSRQTKAACNPLAGEIIHEMSDSTETRGNRQPFMPLNTEVSDIGEDPGIEISNIFIKQRSVTNTKDTFDIDGLTEDASLASVLLQNFTDKEEHNMILEQPARRGDSQLAYITGIRQMDDRSGFSHKNQPSILALNDTRDHALSEGLMKANQSSVLLRSCDVESDAQSCFWKQYYGDIEDYQSHDIIYMHCNSLKESSISNGLVADGKYPCSMSKCMDGRNLIPCLLEQHHGTHFSIDDVKNEDMASGISIVDDEDDISQYINFDLHGTDPEILYD